MKIVYSCVVDQNPKFFSQALSLVASLKAVGVSSDDILINLTPSAKQYRTDFEEIGCLVRDTIFFADGKYSNKVAQLRNAPPEADFIVCCDTDLMFMRNLASDITSKAGLVLGKTVDFDNPPVDRLHAIRKMFDDLPEIAETAADVNGNPTLAGNFNGGLYILPGCHVQAFSKAWEYEALRLFNDPQVRDILSEFGWHIDQISFCFALNKLGLDYETLPITFNFPLHFPLPIGKVENPADIRIVHYHDAVDENGFPIVDEVNGHRHKNVIANASDNLRSVFYLEARKKHAKRCAEHQFTFLVGFHRSGTSLLSSGCDALGYSTGSGELMEASFDNPKGYYENKNLVKLNEAMYRDLLSDWDDIFFTFGDKGEQILDKYRFKIEKLLETEFLISPHANYLLKDPRMMQTYGVWRNGVRTMGCATPRIVFAFRNPLECAESQRSRYQKSYEREGQPFHFFGNDLRETLLLWYVYTIRFFMTLQSEHMIVVRYDDVISNPESTLHRIADWSGMDRDVKGINTFTNAFLEKDMRHHKRDIKELHKATLEIPYVFRLFEQLEEMASQPKVHHKDIQAIIETHRGPFADLIQFDFLGRLFSEPKRNWAALSRAAQRL